MEENFQTNICAESRWAQAKQIIDTSPFHFIGGEIFRKRGRASRRRTMRFEIRTKRANNKKGIRFQIVLVIYLAIRNY